jgi:hypothetical protein
MCPFAATIQAPSMHLSVAIISDQQEKCDYSGPMIVLTDAFFPCNLVPILNKINAACPMGDGKGFWVYTIPAEKDH